MTQTLLANTAVLIAVGAIYALLNGWLVARGWTRGLLLGLLFGIGAVAVMLNPMRIDEGVFFDARGVILALAPVFGGPLSGLVAAVIAAATRVYLGGDGVMVGVCAILIATGFGLALWRWARREPVDIPSWYFLLLGLVVHVVTALAFLLLLPSAYAMTAFSVVGPVMTAVNVPGTWLLAFVIQSFERSRHQGIAMAQEQARRQVTLDRFEAVMNSFPGSVSVFDENQRLVMTNPAFYELLRLEPAAYPIGTHMDDIMRARFQQGEYGDRDIGELHDEVREYLQHHESYVSEKDDVDGKILEVRMRELATGGVVIVHQDVSDRLQREADLRQRNAQLLSIRQIENAYITGNSPQEIYQAILRVILNLSRSTLGFVGEIHYAGNNGPRLQVWAAGDGSDETGSSAGSMPEAAHWIDLSAQDSLLGTVYASGKPAVSNDPSSDPACASILPNHPPLEIILALPIMWGNELVGIIGLGNRQDGFPADAIAPLEPVVNACGLVIASLASRMAAERAELAMRESEAILRLAVAAGNVGIWSWDLITDKKFYSPEWKRQLGYEEHEIGTSRAEWEDRLHPDDRAELLERRKDFLEHATPGLITEFRLRHKDGSYRWILAQSSLFHDESGRPIRMLGTHTDITERKEAEQEILQESARRQILFAQASDGIVVIDETHRVIEANAAFAAMIGRSLEEMPDLHPWDWDYEFRTEEAFLNQYSEVLSEPGSAIVRMRSRSGGTVDVDITYSPADWGGRKVIMCICRDITERLRRDARLHVLSTAVEQSPASILIADTDRRVTYVNPRYEAVSGFSADETVGTVPRVLRPKGPGGALRREIQQALEDGSEWHGEIQSLRKSGEQYWELCSLSAIRDQDGQITNYLLIREDITAARGIEEQLRQAQKMEAVGQLTAGMAHDFNNLLAIIQGNLELAVEANDVNAIHGKIATALRASQRGAALTRKLLAFGRRAPLNPQLTDINQLLAELVPLLERTLGDAISIEQRLDASTASIEIDRSQMENAIINLAVNARDAMPGGGVLSIETTEAEYDANDAGQQKAAPTGRYLMIAVADTGIGMDSQVAAYAFDPFFTTKAVGKGSGLGLSMVYGFVKQSGGHARIVSTPGAGTTVQLYFPFSEQAGPAGGAGDAEITGEFELAGKGERILVVENDDDVRETMSSQLRSLGYDVLTEPGGQSAIDFITGGGQCDLMLCDVVLDTGYSGPDVATQLRLFSPESRVIYMSGYSDQAVMDDHGVAETETVLQKPIRRLDLAQALRRELGNDSE